MKPVVVPALSGYFWEDILLRTTGSGLLKKRWKKSKFLRRPTWQTVLKALGILSITDPVALDLLKTLATALNAAAGRSGIDQEDLK